jgi:hypothetical protein
MSAGNRVRCDALWFGLAVRGSSGRLRRPSLTGLHHALMAAAMIWMLTAVPGTAGMRRPGMVMAPLAAVSGAALHVTSHGPPPTAASTTSVYLTYSTTARGREFRMGYYGFLDRTPLGRNEGDAPMRECAATTSSERGRDGPTR